MKRVEIPVVELRGAPRERGRAHGEALRERIGEMLDPYRALLERVTGASSAELCGEFRARTAFDRAMARWTPGLLEELDGIAEGAGCDRELLWLYNCTDESEWFLRHRRLGAALPDARGCSSLAIADASDGVVRVAQNMDIPSATCGRGALLRVIDDDQGSDAWVFTVAGLLGVIGMSRSGVAVANNSLRMLAVRPDGLPVNAVVRGLLAQPDYDAAVTFLERAPHASGQSWVLGGRGRTDTFECSAGGAVRLEPAARSAHTNHPLASGDLHPDPRFHPPRSSSSTHARLEALRRRVPPDAAAPGPDELRAALASHDDPEHPVCRHPSADHPGRNYSAASVIYELREPPRMRLAPGPPCETAFESYGFD